MPTTLVHFVQALAVSYAAGVNAYATVAVLGIAKRAGWIDSLPGVLDAVGSPWIIGLACLLYAFEFLATLVPGVASAWETVHTLIRPPAAALLAVATVWDGGAAVVLGAALVGGSLGLTTHVTKLGIRYAVDTSPEPVTNGVVNVAELSVVAALAWAVWHHPLLTLGAALLLLVAMLLLLRALGRKLRKTWRRMVRKEA